MKRTKALFFILILFCFFSSTCLGQESIEALKLEIKSFTLDNGLLFLVVERHTSPQVACRVAIRAGSALEETGKTGIAHLLEHMMFKGTKNYGTLNPLKDQELQEKIETAYQVILAEKQKRDPDQKLIQEKTKEMEQLRLEVQQIFVPEAFSSQVERNGAVGVNAYTSKDQTQYMMEIPADMLEQWFSIVSEQLFEPAWREFYVEKEVVKREWAFRYINSPRGAAWLDLYATAFQAHPYKNPTIGWRSDMDFYNTRDAISFHQSNYNPTNAVCVLVGDLTLERAKELAKIYFLRYPGGKRAIEEVTSEPQQEGPRKSIRYFKGARTPLLMIGYHGAKMGSDDFYALDAMTMILSHGLSSRIKQHIINQGLSVEAWAGNPDNRYGSLVIFAGSPNEPEGLQGQSISEEEKRKAYQSACEKLEQLLLIEIDRFKHEPVTDRELSKIKKLMQREFLDRIRSNEELAGTLATLEVQLGWQYLLSYTEKIEKVGKEDIIRVAGKYLNPEKRNIVYVIPGGKPDQAPVQYHEDRSSSGSARARIKKPEKPINYSSYDTPKGWKHPLSFERRPEKINYPKAERSTFKGAKIFYLPDRELPLIDLTLLVKAGKVDLENRLTGLTSLLEAGFLRGGTENLKPAELAAILDDNAIQISISVNDEDTTIRLSVLKDDWEKGLSLLNELLTQPGFDEQILPVLKEQALISLRRQGGDGQAVAGREWNIWHFKEHPYGRDPLLGLSTIPAITREDILAFIKKYFVPANMTVAVAGDIGLEEIKEGFSNHLFKDFAEKTAPERNLSDPEKTPPILGLIHKPGQVQSQVRLGMGAIKRSHPDFWKLNLLMSILGGSDSLMFTRLRADLGLIYAGWFGLTYRWQAGFLTGYIGCRADKTSQALRETVGLMEELRQGISEEALKQKRLDALNSFVFNVDTPKELVETYGRYDMRQEPLNTLDKIQDAFMVANREDLRELAQTYLNPRQLQIIVVADKTTRVRKDDARIITLEEDLKALASELNLPYLEIELR